MCVGGDSRRVGDCGKCVGGSSCWGRLGQRTRDVLKQHGQYASGQAIFFRYWRCGGEKNWPAAPALASKDFISWPVFLVVVLSKAPQLWSFRLSSAMQHAAWRELEPLRWQGG